MNLFQKIVEVRKTIDVMQKEGRGFGYSYVKGAQILGIIKGKMDELGLILSPEIGEVKTPYIDEYETTNRQGATKVYRDWITEGFMSYTFINSEKPDEKHTCRWWFTGSQDDPAKSFGSALTYSERYFLLKFFGIETDDDDPDKKTPKGDNAKPKAKLKTLTASEVDSKWNGKIYSDRLVYIDNVQYEIPKEQIEKLKTHSKYKKEQTWKKKIKQNKTRTNINLIYIHS